MAKNNLKRLINNCLIVMLLSPLFLNFHKDNAFSGEAIDQINSKKTLIEINTRLEHLDRLIQGRDVEKACIQSEVLVNLISQDISTLKLLEPQHNWQEIKEALLEISKEKCE